MEINYKYCERCETKVALNTTKCIVCGNEKFVTQAEVDEAAKALLEYVSAQQQNVHWTLRVGAWLKSLVAGRSRQ